MNENIRNLMKDIERGSNGGQAPEPVKVSGRVEDLLRALDRSPKEPGPKSLVDPAERAEEGVSDEMSPRMEGRLRRAFDTPGFLDFLDKHPNPAFELSTPEETLAIFEAFQVKDKIVNTIKGVAQEHFSNVLKIDNVDSLSAVEKTITQWCFDNPKLIADVGQEVDRALRLAQEIPALQKKLEAQSGLVPPASKEINDDLKQEIDLLDKARATIGFFGLRKMTPSSVFGEGRQARKAVAEAGTPLTAESLEERAKKLEETLKSNEAQEKKLENIQVVLSWSGTTFNQLRTHMIQDALNIGSVREELQAKVVEKLQAMIDGNTSLEDLENAQAYFETIMRQTGDQKESYFAGVADMQKLINQAIEGGLYNEVSRLFTTLNGQGQGEFSRLEKAVEVYLVKNKLGSRRPEEIRQLVLDSIARLEKDGVSRAVKLRIKAYLMLNGQKFKAKAK